MCYYQRLVSLFIYIIILSIISCKPQNISVSKSDGREYYEDLSYVRSTDSNRFSLESKYSENTFDQGLKVELDSIISIIKAESVEIKELDGFTIQIYLGDDRLKAEETEKKLKSIDSLIFSKTICVIYTNSIIININIFIHIH